ncbi:MAG TPA: glycogen debranching protein GlgX [Gammaproteobacteria bacterium]
MTHRYRVTAGHRFPVGATASANGVNFSIFSRHATRVWLRLYEHERDREPVFEVELDPEVHRTFFFWHVFLEGAPAGLYYTWRMDGPYDPERGLLFDPRRELLDPWARLVSDALWDRRAARRGEPGTAIRGRIIGRDTYDWEGDEPLQRPFHESIIYEMHVRGFTRHPSAGVQHPGTYRGVIEKIPYLQSLGITDVELLPVQAFDPQDVPDGVAARGLRNFWGYSPYGYFAPHPHYAETDPRTEFRDMVKALHRAGIGVILDVVLNHTAEGGENGVTISFKGLGNEFVYHLDPADKRKYRDFTGCGNTVNANHPLVARFLLQTLEFWVREMHVDGFRLDLASVLARGEDGEPAYHAPVLWNIEFSSVLETTHLIAEAWDTSLHQVGDFPGLRWSEWNSYYRDAMRRFLRGDGGLIGEVATRIAGSSDLYGNNGKSPASSVNFVTCHDGFTLWDLMSYERKHNEANGEDNRDGSDHNLSWNGGVEGPTDDPVVNRLRAQRARNAVAILMLSQGVPMLLAGDERLRTQRGNNNAYCQDNEIGWIDWTPTREAEAMVRFTRELIALRKRHPSLRRTRFIPRARPGFKPGIRWYGAGHGEPDWHDPEARVLCFTLDGLTDDEPSLHVMLNMSREQLLLPLPRYLRWARLVDTALDPPQDALPPEQAPLIDATDYRVQPLSVAVFESR